MTKRTPGFSLLGESGNAILRLLGLIMLTGTLSSCFPGPYGAYYRPSYPDKSAILERRDCYGAVGPRSVLKLTAPDNTKLWLRIDTNRQGQLELTVVLLTPQFSTLQFTSNIIHLLDAEKSKEWIIEAKALDVSFPSGPIPYNNFVDIAKVTPTAPANILNDLEVWISFSIHDFSPDSVWLHLPPIITGNDRYVIPPILLQADKEKREYKKGRWDWWPYEWKDAKIAGFTIKGGATGGPGVFGKIDIRLRKSELGGNIMIYFPADKKWKFNSNEIQFEDVASGDVRQIHFTHLQPHFRSEDTFIAPLCCGGDANILLPIGEERPEKLRIKIPPILINGKEFVIKPITFDLKRLEFGIYPFNC